MISVDEFTEKLEAEFEDLQKGTLTPDVDYRTISGWSSMHALIVIAFVDANFDVLLTGTDLKSTKTIRELYDIIQQKK